MVSTCLDKKFIQILENSLEEDTSKQSLRHKDYIIEEFPNVSKLLIVHYLSISKDHIALSKDYDLDRSPALFAGSSNFKAAHRIFIVCLGKFSAYFGISKNGAMSGPWPNPHQVALEYGRQTYGRESSEDLFPLVNFRSASPFLEDHLPELPRLVSDTRISKFGYTTWLVKFNDLIQTYLIEGPLGILPRRCGSLDDVLLNVHRDVHDRSLRTGPYMDPDGVPDLLEVASKVFNMSRASVGSYHQKLAHHDNGVELPVVPLRNLECIVYRATPERSYNRRQGEIQGAAQWVAEDHARHGKLYGVISPEALVADLRNVALYDSSIIVTADGHVVSESLLNSQNLENFGPFCRRTDGNLQFRVSVHGHEWFERDKTPVLLKQRYDNNYSHWLIESLPRVEIIGERLDLESCCFLVGKEDSAMADIYVDTLQVLGVSSDRIVALPSRPLIFGRLIYPAPVTKYPWVIAPRVIEFLESIPGRIEQKAVGFNMIYVRRPSKEVPRFVNEDEIVELAVRHGFSVVDDVSKLSFKEQIDRFRCATHVIGALDVALTNICFAPRGIRLLVLSGETTQDDFLWNMTGQKRGHYFSLHGRLVRSSNESKLDFHIDKNSFSSMLKLFENDS